MHPVPLGAGYWVLVVRFLSHPMPAGKEYMPSGIRYLWLCLVEVLFGPMPQGMGCWFPGHIIASGSFWIMINHSAVSEKSLLEIAGLWPHLIRDVPALRCRTGTR